MTAYVFVEWEWMFNRLNKITSIFVVETDVSWKFYAGEEPFVYVCERMKAEDSTDNLIFANTYLSLDNFIKVDDVRDSLDEEDLLEEDVEVKHKYIKRLGSPGNYRYFYRDKNTGKLFRGQAPKKELGNRKKILDKAIKQANEKISQSDRKKISGVMDRFKKGEDSKKANMDKNGEYNTERNKLHKEIMGKPEFNNAKAINGEKKLFILAGAPASGKTSSLKHYIKDEEYVDLNSDGIKEYLDVKGEKFDGYNVALLHRESSDVFKKMIDVNIKKGSNILLDQTMKNSAKSFNLIKKFKEEGYEIHLLASFVEPHKAVERASARFKETKRFVPYELVGSVSDKIKKNSYDLKEYVDKFTFVDNNADWGVGKPFKIGG